MNETGVRIIAEFLGWIAKEHEEILLEYIQKHPARAIDIISAYKTMKKEE